MATFWHATFGPRAIFPFFIFNFENIFLNPIIQENFLDFSFLKNNFNSSIFHL